MFMLVNHAIEEMGPFCNRKHNAKSPSIIFSFKERSELETFSSCINGALVNTCSG